MIQEGLSTSTVCRGLKCSKRYRVIFVAMPTVKKSKRLQRVEAQTKKRVKRAHDKAERKGEKVVATRTVGHGNPRGLTQTAKKENIYQKEREAGYKGMDKEMKVEARDAKKAERKAKRKGKAPRGTGIPKRAKAPRGRGRDARQKPPTRKSSGRAKRCGKESQRKLRASGGSAAMK